MIWQRSHSGDEVLLWAATSQPRGRFQPASKAEVRWYRKWGMSVDRKRCSRSSRLPLRPLQRLLQPLGSRQKSERTSWGVKGLKYPPDLTRKRTPAPRMWVSGWCLLKRAGVCFRKPDYFCRRHYCCWSLVKMVETEMDFGAEEDERP